MGRVLPIAAGIAALSLVLASGPGRARVVVWYDEAGQPHLSNDPDAVPPSAEARSADHGVGRLWLGGPVDPAAEPRTRRAGDARVERLLRGAVEDLERGETARAAEAFEDILRDRPSRPEPHWYLAHLDRERGRFESAEGHLRAFLASAGDRFETWRQQAQERLVQLEDERRMADRQVAEGPLRLVAIAHPHFRIRYDAELGAAPGDYAGTVVGFLEGARQSVAEQLGTVPREPTGVVLYGKAAYLSAYGHRFSFRTVGFFDGRIHVASAAHPTDELRALLYHEYTHALFREQTGGDRPFWLNEGLAELLERIGRGQRGLLRQERARLRVAIDAGDWLPLRSLARGFAGLDDRQARIAYLEAAAAAAWLVEHTDWQTRATLLARLGAGISADVALGEAIGRNTDGLDAAVRTWVLGEFVPAAQ